MRRRDFLTVLGSTAAWPLAAHAQQQALPVIGYLESGVPELSASRLAAVRKGLSEAGFVEGQNVAIEYRWADGQNDRLPSLAADLVRRQVGVIVTNLIGAMVAKAATTTIPIVFTTPTDPVALGLVASLNRPGGNLTGAASLNSEMLPKLLEMLHEIMPATTSFAALMARGTPANRVETDSRNLQAAARTLGVQIHILQAGTEHEIDVAFSSLAQLPASGLVIQAGAFFGNQRERLAGLALRYRVPTIFQYREFAVAGGLASYGGDLADAYRVAGSYAGRILKGEKPADLPVQQSTKAELIINLKTAKALGLTVPLPLLARADEVIE
jgi:putative ABC transport system substrate-binding protein